MTYVSVTPNRALGKNPAVFDPRLMGLHQVFDLTKLTSVPKWANWRAGISSLSNGVPMLGNDVYGCCFWASIFHYIQLAAAYTQQPLPSEPTTAECLAAYSACTGFDPNNHATDKGTMGMGPGGAFEFWTKTGVVCGGKLNKLTNVVTVDFKNPDNMKKALQFGPVFSGALVTNADVNSPFMWDVRDQVEGGHEFLTLGYETLLSGKTYYDVETWDGEWRYTDDWMAAGMDEVAMPLDAQFFNASGIDPADVDMASVMAAMDALKK